MKEFDPYKISMRALEVAEKEWGLSLGRMMSMVKGNEIEIKSLDAKTLQGMLYLIKSSSGEAITPDDVKDLTIGDLTEYFDDGEDEDGGEAEQGDPTEGE